MLRGWALVGRSTPRVISYLWFGWDVHLVFVGRACCGWIVWAALSVDFWDETICQFEMLGFDFEVDLVDRCWIVV